MSKTYHLHKWSVAQDSDPFKAPEQRASQLQGLRSEDHQIVLTSPVVKIEGKRITTYSGSVYILEDIDPEYLAWMTKEGYTLDEENPLKFKRSE